MTEDYIIRIGTDCSGIDAPIQALKNLKVKFSHEFSSDIDENCYKSIVANHCPKIFFKDMRNRNSLDIPDIDIYVCGFPCQPFSLAGERLGFNDDRGDIFYYCLDTIKAKLPKIFILENVKGLVNLENGKVLDTILKSLKNLKKYDIYWKVVNTRDYGIPQNRERLYIVGILEGNHEGNPFLWSKKKNIDIWDIVDFSDTKIEKIPEYLKRKKFFEQIPTNSVFVNITFTQNSHKNANKYSPCITTNNGLWCVPMHRRANIKEYLRLQGFPDNFHQVVSDNEFKKQIGNSMSINILEHIFENIFQNFKFP